MSKITDQVLLACAHAAHEANRAYCNATGDTSQPPWDAAPDWQRSSAINGVCHVLVNGNGPKESHETWLAEKRANGWIYGATKDPDKKTHPCMVPYSDLPDVQKRKDEIYVAVVKSVAAALA